MKNSKTKKILSILLAVVMVVGVLPITAFAVAPSEPTNLRWEGTTAKWDAVPDAVKYQVCLYPKGGGAVFAHDEVMAPTTEYTGFATYMVPGMTYEFGVIAVNANGEVSNSTSYAWSDEYTVPGETGVINNVRWDGYTLKWDSYSGATGYWVALQRENEGSVQVATYYLDTNSVDFEYDLAKYGQGDYSVRISAYKDNVFNTMALVETRAWTFETVPTFIDTVEIAGVAAPEFGASADIAPEYTLPSDANYTVQSAKWVDKGGVDLVVGSTFEGNTEYFAEFVLVPKDGCVFAHTDILSATINGEAPDLCVSEDDGAIKLRLEMNSQGFCVVSANAEPVAGGTITGAGIYNPEDLVTVNAVANQGFVFKEWQENGVQVSTNASYSFVATKPNYNLVAVFEQEELSGVAVGVSASPTEGGTVTGGGIYESYNYVRLTATANPGYKFVRWTENGSEVSTANPYNAWISTTDRTLVAEFNKIISEVNLTGFTIPGAGDHASIDPTATSESGKGYFINSGSWFDNNGDKFTGDFEFGKTYAAVLYLRAQDGYEFADTASFSATVNGGVVTVESVDVYNYSRQNDAARVNVTFTVTEESDTVINIIEINNVATPIDGTDTSTPPKYALPSKAKYTIESAEWWSGYTDEKTEDKQFIEGNSYRAVFTIVPKAGCEFANGVTVKINGEEAIIRYTSSDEVSVAVKFTAVVPPIAPTASVPDGTKFATDDMPVTITCEDADAEIYVGLYGNDPRLEASSYRWKWTNGDTLYMGRNYETSLSSFDGYISKGNDVSLKIASVKDGVWSDVVTYTYHKIGSGEITAPTATPGSCSFVYGNSIKVSLKSDVKGAVIMYSRDGGETSYTYTSPLTVSKTTELTVWTVSAFTIGKNYLSSKVTYSYTEKPGVGGTITTLLDNSDAVTTIELWNADNTQLIYSTTETGKNPTYSIPVTEYGTYNLVVTTAGHVPYYKTINLNADSIVQDVELNLYADTNLDGVIDIQDYQALVNAVLSDDHEQIETEEYDDLIQYDLVMDGYLDALDAAVMALVIKGHKTIDEVYDIKKGDYDLDGEAYTESDLIAMYHVLSDIDSSAPTLSTSQKFAADLNYNGKVDEGDLAILTGRYGTIE